MTNTGRWEKIRFLMPLQMWKICLALQATDWYSGVKRMEYFKKIWQPVPVYHWQVEFGRRKMSARFAKKIEDACDVSASWLLYGDEQSKENPCGDKMIEFLRKTPEARKIVWEMMEREND